MTRLHHTEPPGGPVRQTAMNLHRLLAALVLTAALAFSTAACGGDAGADTATDPATETASTTSTPAPTGPTVEPEPGQLPDFAYSDYAFTLEQRCFCANIDQKYRITVQGGEVVAVTWATAGRGHQVGDDVPGDLNLRMTIQDVIDLGNQKGAAQIDVDWPAGQLYPTSVYIDREKTIADEEVTWVISDVVNT
jgi:hypothetical protein